MYSNRILLLLVTAVFVVAAVLCHLVALLTSHWLKSSSASKSDFLNLGLWVACFHDYVHLHEVVPKTYDGCHYISSSYYKTIQPWLSPAWLVTVRIAAIIGLILQIIGVVFVFFLFVWVLCKWVCGRKNDDCCQRCLIYVTPILFIVAGMFIMMAAMAFADNAFKLQCKEFWVGGDPNNNHLSYSWGFEVASCVLTFISGGLLIWLAVLTGRTNPPYALVGK